MTDVFTKSKRSEVMSRIRGSGNSSTELRLIELMRKYRISGWRRGAPLFGKPDFVFKTGGLCVFVDGCFWHACPKCFSPPRQNADFWMNKIGGNRRRDKKVSRKLRSEGWSVCRIYECDLKKRPEAVIGRIRRMLGLP
jgi:DNA mismatch endonuclease (patch repair protein)